MRILYTLVLSTVSFIAVAQFTNPDLQTMVAAEQAFIQKAKDENTRDAFLYYLSDDAVTVGPQGPVKGKESLTNSPVSPGWLKWAVAYCDISSSGDMGYNTGPWEFRAQPADEKAVAFGEFHSIWKKQPDGTWKNVLDIGIRHGQATANVQPTTTNIPLKPSAPKKKGNVDVSTIADLEKQFITRFAADSNHALVQYASAELRLSREGMLPITTPDAVQAYLKNGLVPTYSFIDGGIASSADFGYAYGTAEVAVREGGHLAKKKATYLRVWKKENNNDWRIVLDVLTYQ